MTLRISEVVAMAGFVVGIFPPDQSDRVGCCVCFVFAYFFARLYERCELES
jgi:hypothetical protein